MTGVSSKYRVPLSFLSSLFRVWYWLPLVSLCLILTVSHTETAFAQDSKEQTKKQKKAKKKKRKKDKKTAQFKGSIDRSAESTNKRNPTKQKRKKTVKYEDRIGAGKTPGRTPGTKHAGRTKQKSVGKAKGTQYGGQKVNPESRLKGNPTKQKGTTGKNYQERIGANKSPQKSPGTTFSGKGGRSKAVGSAQGTNYRGAKVPVDDRPRGNPTKNVGRGKKYQERIGNQLPPRGADGTTFSGRGRPKKIPQGTQGTNYRGQSNAGSSSTAGGRTTIYGERGRNNKGGGVPEIKQRDQGTTWRGAQRSGKTIVGTPGTSWSGNQKSAKSIGGTRGTTWQGDQRRGPGIQGTAGTNWKGDQRRSKSIGGTPGTNWRGDQRSSKSIAGAPGTTWRGDQRVRPKLIRDYGGDWAGDLKLKKAKRDRRVGNFTMKGYKPKEIGPAPGTTFAGHLRKPKKITGWDGSDFAGHLKVKRNNRIKTEGTKFAGHLKVKPNAKIKTEGLSYRGNTKVKTRFFQNQYYRKKSRQEQLFAGNYKVRRTKGKDLHPSANYTGRQVRRSPTAEKINRKWKLLWAKTNKNADQPKHLKGKRKKPKYDPKEREIWND